MPEFTKRGLTFEIYHNSLYLPKEQILIISDIHLGYEKHLQGYGITVVKDKEHQTVTQIKKVLQHYKHKIKTIIINGDIKEEYTAINWDEKEQIAKLVVLLKKEVKNVIFIKGNHDALLPIVLQKFDMPYYNTYQIGLYFFTHGHKIHKIPKESKYLIIGHAHPAISMTDGIRSENFKCFMLGKYKDKTLIVLPSFIDLTRGFDIRLGDFLTPYLRKNENIDDFDIIATEQEHCLDFGKFKDIK